MFNLSEALQEEQKANVTSHASGMCYFNSYEMSLLYPLSGKRKLHSNASVFIEHFDDAITSLHTKSADVILQYHAI